MSTYTGSAPSGPAELDKGIISFFESFYALSDNPSEQAHKDYVDSMTKDALFIMGTKKATGADEIMTLRKGLWSGPVKTRKHSLHRIYPFTSHDAMVHGNVDYELRNGAKVTVDWAAHAQFVKSDDGKLRMKFYQVYLDSAPVAQAAASK